MILSVPRGTSGSERGGEVMDGHFRGWNAKEQEFYDYQRKVRRRRELRSDLRKFERAHGDESNNQQMDDFCLKAIKKIQQELAELENRI